MNVRLNREQQSNRGLPLTAAVYLCALLLCAAVAACGRPEPRHVDVPDAPLPPAEAQSDFLDIGKAANIRWLSFAPAPHRDLPTYYAGLGRDERRRTHLAPHPSPEQVLLRFDLPRGANIRLVDWLGTTLVAIDINARQYSVSFVEDTGLAPEMIARLMANLRGRSADDGGPVSKEPGEDGAAYFTSAGGLHYGYGARRLKARSGAWTFVAEVRMARPDAARAAEEMRAILDGISVVRELAYEGLPGHRCLSTMEELDAGVLRYAGGILRLPLPDGADVRKLEGGSTVRIDAHRAGPWLLIRELGQSDQDGDLRVRVRADPSFRRRLSRPSARFSAGILVEDAVLPFIYWDYRDAGSEYVVLGVLKAGDELLAVELVSLGAGGSENRRRLRDKALEMLKKATAEPATEAPEFAPLAGWNVGTMGRD